MKRNELIEAVAWLDSEIEKLDNMRGYFPVVQESELKQAITHLYIAREDLSKELYGRNKMTALEFLAKLTAILADFNADDIADCEIYVADEDGGWKCPKISLESGDLVIYGQEEE